jgi:CRISPR-associated protein Cmr2
MTKSNLLVFSIGPVQSFIEAARKLEDLWSGSYILSYLSETAMTTLLQLTKQKGISAEMIYPSATLEQLLNPVAGPQIEVASLPNRFVCLLKGDTKEVSQVAEQVSLTVKEKFADFCTQGVERVFGHDSTVAQALTVMAVDQAMNFLEVFWAIEPIDKEVDYQQHRLQLEKRLAAVKNNKLFSQLEQEGPVCTVCGEKDALHHQPFPSDQTMGEMRKQLRVTWQKRKKSFQPAQGAEDSAARIKDGEYLCGICLAKRVAREYFQKCKDVPSYFRKYESLVAIAGEIDYYAVLMLDGDDMGQWFSRESTISYHRQLSNKLTVFSQDTVPNLVRQHRGRLVYSGGDDVLVFMPVDQSLELALSLQTAFASEDKGLAKGATCSAGLVIAHQKAPLSRVLSHLRRMEKQAKSYLHEDGSKKKDALALTVLTKGEMREAVMPWEAVPFAQQVSEAFISHLSTTFLYAFGQAFLPLMGKNYNQKLTVIPHSPDLNRQLLTAELERVINRSWKEDSGSAEKGKKLAEDLISLHGKMTSTLQFIHLLEIMRFFKKKAEVSKSAATVS